jgi:hypothetical protein
MRTLLALVTCFFLGWSVSSRTSQVTGEAPGPLAPLAPLVGRTWITTFPNGALTDTQRFEWMYGRKFVRNPHQVKDAAGQVVYEGETIYGWDAGAGELRWWYFNATGGWIDGTVAVEDDGTLVFEGENHGGTGQTAKVRSSAHFEGDDRWLSTTWFWRDGEWQVERELEFAPAE